MTLVEYKNSLMVKISSKFDKRQPSFVLIAYKISNFKFQQKRHSRKKNGRPFSQILNSCRRDGKK